MMICVTIVSYSVLINGKPKGKIIPSRGLWQGDLISPFLLCADGLFAMLKKEEAVGHIKGITICREAPRISHLLFVDGNIVFCGASIKESSRVVKVLEDYESDSGQKLNKEKTSIFFSKNTSRETQEQVKQ